MGQNIVIKVGGSLLYKLDLTFNTSFINMLVKWYEANRSRYNKIVLVVGGGKLSRHVGKNIESYTNSQEDLHRVGMQATLMNATLIKAILRDEDIKVPMELGDALEAAVDTKTRTIICGGFKAGWSTDMSAAVLCNALGHDRFYKLSDIDHVYTADPKLDPTATIIKEITWDRFFDQFGIDKNNPEQKPNEHTPVGAVAAQFCSQKGISVVLSGGKTFEEKKSLGEVFESGTLIHP